MVEEGYTLHTERNLEVWKDIITATGSQRVLEIGYNLGHTSTILLDLGCDVRSVDINPNCMSMMLNMAAAYPKFSFEIKDSMDMVWEDYKNFDMVFVDGEHSVKALNHDLDLASNMGVKHIVVDDFGAGYFIWIKNFILDKPNFPYKLVGEYTYDSSDGENVLGVFEKCS